MTTTDHGTCLTCGQPAIDRDADICDTCINKVAAAPHVVHAPPFGGGEAAGLWGELCAAKRRIADLEQRQLADNADKRHRLDDRLFELVKASIELAIVRHDLDVEDGLTDEIIEGIVVDTWNALVGIETWHGEKDNALLAAAQKAYLALRGQKTLFNLEEENGTGKTDTGKPRQS